MGEKTNFFLGLVKFCVDDRAQRTNASRNFSYAVGTAFRELFAIDLYQGRHPYPFTLCGDLAAI